jgi:anthranilate phosphoribosyltransferase
MTALAGAIRALDRGQDPSVADLESAFGEVLAGDAEAVQVAAFLTLLRGPRLTEEAVAAGARAMRARMIRVDLHSDAIDVCGTGGDGAQTLNISTATTFVLAGCGVKVAKHGNRAMSSKSGAADVLEALGVKLSATHEVHRRSIEEAGTTFLFAQHHHPALAPLAPVRKALGFRTVFNFLGPLCNPASVKRQAVGVASPEMVERIAGAFGRLGSTGGIVYCSSEGVDELTLGGGNVVCRIGGPVGVSSIDAASAGLTPSALSAIRGGDALENAKALKNLLEGSQGAYRDTVALNAGAVLHAVTGHASSLRDGVEMALESIDAGRAKASLAKLIEITEAAP